MAGKVIHEATLSLFPHFIPHVGRAGKNRGFDSSQIKWGLTHSSACEQLRNISPNLPMKTGRTPVWNPFRDHSAGSWTELATMADRGRLTIPAAVRRCVDWLTPLPKGGLLATVEPTGRVELLPWAPLGEALIDLRLKQLATAKDPARGELLIALADKHFRLTLEEPVRLGLPPSLQSFLNASDQPIRMVAMHQQLWLWNERLWQTQRADRELLIG